LKLDGKTIPDFPGAVGHGLTEPHKHIEETHSMPTTEVKAANELADYQQLVGAMGDAVIVCDSGGVIRLWNAAAERLFGLTPAEALGSSLDLIIPERLQERHWAGFTKTIAAGQTRYEHDVLRVPAKHKDGRALSIAFTVGLLVGSQKKVTGLVAVIRDDTKRFAEERDLRKRLAELEKNTERERHEQQRGLGNRSLSGEEKLYAYS
jgi:PAS domain S-box-containing protein